MTTREELVEAMARAMCTYQDQDPDRVLESMDKHRQPVIMWTHWKGEADAALSVLRQWLADERLVVVPSTPTREMLLKAGATPDGISPRGGTDYLGKMLPKYYTAMIAAAPDALETKP